MVLAPSASHAKTMRKNVRLSSTILNLSISKNSPLFLSLSRFLCACGCSGE
ncbi:hypothetical protein LguiA_026743 [Lonicera macranthoides]